MEVVVIMTAEEKQEFLDAVAKAFCPECGRPVYQKARGRKKIFCSDACRFAWKNRHPKPENWKSTRTLICPVCGKEFMVTREYKRIRKYCSRSCSNVGRAAERRNNGRASNEADRDGSIG